LLQAADVSFGYRRETVLHGVSVATSRGALLGILGPNGSGKTTLLRLLAGLLRPRSGRVTLDNEDLAALPRHAVARRLAVVPQETHLAFEYSVLEIALMGRYPHLGAFELEGPHDVQVAREALAATGTLALADRPFDTLSGGEKQRVVIASALAQFAPARAPHGARQEADATAGQVLLLDEPTASLDLHYQLEVAALLRQLNAERGLTVVVSTHDLNFAAAVCRDLVLLRDGRVLAAGRTGDVLTAAAVRDLYGVEADVGYHERAGHLTVVPLAGQATRQAPR
jgi:iron complex transport system ATP-binding protein